MSGRTAGPSTAPPDRPGDDDAVRATVDAVWKMEAPAIIARLARDCGDIAEAEDAAQDALLAALERWPDDGVPDRPGAWLMSTARRRLVDRHRRGATRNRYAPQVAESLKAAREDTTDRLMERLETGVDDDLLRLVFICCHPAVPLPGRVALTLRLLGGLTTEQIARAFLVPVPTMSQRIVRARRALRSARAPFEMPPRHELADRLDAVFAVVYLIFNEGYAPTDGAAVVRPELCSEAMRLARVVAGLAPDEPEAHGLAALLDLHGSRLRTRVDRSGAAVPLDEQNRAAWDRLLIARGLESLGRAARTGRPFGPYCVQASIAACHATAPDFAATDWPRIATLYAELGELAPSPVVELNRAVAVARAGDPAAALAVIEGIDAAGDLPDYPLLDAARGDALRLLGRLDEARAAFARAAAGSTNTRERDVLLRRARDLTP